MEKGESTASPLVETLSARPSAPPVSASPSHPAGLPPTYEEAIAQSMGVNSPVAPPYPTNETRMPMPITTPYVVSPVHTTQPHGSAHPESSFNNLPPSYPVTSEIRIPRRPGTYILAPSSVKMQCPSCLADIKTSIVSDHQPMAHVCCLLLCCLGCCLCSCLPYCMSAFMTVHHFCPRCKVYIGTWKGFETSRRFMAVRV